MVSPSHTTGGRSILSVIPSVSLVIALLGFYILVASKVITGWVPTCDRMHALKMLCSAAPVEVLAASTLAQYPSQSIYLGSRQTNPINAEYHGR